MSRSFNFKALRGKFKTTVVTDELALEESLRLLLSKVNEKLHERGNVPERVVALDIEKSFCSASYGMVKERVVVLMLGVENDCLIIHLTHFEKLPTSLSKFLDLSDITFVGVSIKSNLADLQRDYGIQCRNGVDLGVFAAAVRDSTGISAYPLPCIVRCSNIDFCKPADVAFSEWGTSMLSEKQIEHASLVVHKTFKIVEQLWQRYLS
ncbi:uncharacterized protein LOC118349581 [Juglans regia]|uniref:Uncharacterized protein LOC118349581 n=1 Tax=Juglans regia TaxID=51240 RepID=A0A6P9ESR1_JUGRE|nr:uncharacterized protein LOC118349581 [Juglans regia]